MAGDIVEILEDSKMDEVPEGKNCCERGDIAEMNNEEEVGTKNKKRRKRERLGGDVVGSMTSDGIESMRSDKERKKRRYWKTKLGVGLLQAVTEKPDNESSRIQCGMDVGNEGSVSSIGDEICDRSRDNVNVEDGFKVKKAKSDKHCSKDKNKNVKQDKKVSDGDLGSSDIVENQAPKRAPKRVEFSDNVEGHIVEILKDSKMDEVPEGKSCCEHGDIAEMNNEEEVGAKNKKRRKRENLENLGGGDVVGSMTSDGIESLRSDKEGKKRRRYRETKLGVGLLQAVNEKQDNENTVIQGGMNVGNEGNVGSIGDGICDSSRDAVNVEDGFGVKKAKSDKHCSKDKKKNAKQEKLVSDGNVGPSDTVENPTPERASKRVKFSDNVEVLSSTNALNDGIDYQGKRFSPEEDKIIEEAISKYIETHGLGANGKDMILNCKEHPELRGCWKEIAAALPWRTSTSVYSRAHIVCNRAEEQIWTAEERQLILNFHKENGPKWRMLADALGKNRIHTKDAFRRNKLPNLKKGRWSQEEYQTLFDLVNMDLRMRAFEERKIKHGMMREAISWEAISEKLSTRSHCSCATKWYDQLTSPMSRPAKKKGP